MTDYRKRIIERRESFQREKKAALRREAEKLIRTAAKELPFRRAFLFGSVAGTRPVSVWSDIDIVVEGLPEERYFEMIGHLRSRSRHEIDLKPLESLPQDVREEILARGIIIYERE